MIWRPPALRLAERLKAAAGPPDPRRLIALLLAAATGYAAWRARIPLAWILGPLVATAAAGLAGLPVATPVAARRFGQTIVGANLGLHVSAGVLGMALLWLPVMVVSALASIVLAAVLSVPFARAGRIDGLTAYYAMMPGGLSEMANIGASAGARPEPIALTQALRVALLVLVLPPAIVALDIHGLAAEGEALPALGATATLAALGVGLAGVLVARLSRLNNPWMIGSLVCVGAASAAGLLHGALPAWLFYLGQFLIGIAIGSRFRRDNVMRLPRVLAVSGVFILVLAALLFGYAVLLSRITPHDLATIALCVSPGGFAEMAVTAQTLHLSVGLVTAFHVVRAFIVNGFAETCWRGLERLGLFRLMESLIGRRPS